MDPATQAAITPWLFGASIATSVVGIVAGASASSEASEFNARQAAAAGEQSRMQAGIEEARQRRQAARLLGSQRAATAGSGVNVEGSPLLVMMETAGDAEYDAQLIKYGGEIRASTAFAQAASDRMAARAARTGGYIGAGGSLLRGASLYTASAKPDGDTPAAKTNIWMGDPGDYR